jgi:hypothetical protein
MVVQALALSALLSFTGCGPKSVGNAAGGGARGVDGGTLVTSDAGAGPTLGATAMLTISPAAPVARVTVVNGVTTLSAVTLTASAAGGMVPSTWSFDRPDLGAVAATTGVFTPSGQGSGTGHVTATSGALSVTVPLAVTMHITQNGAPGGADAGADAGAGGFGGVGGSGFGGEVDPATVTILTGAARAPASAAELGWLYPYDQTVWPRGMLAPLVQWQTTHSASAVYLHLTQANYEFEGFYSGTGLVNQPLDATAWARATDGNGGDSLQAQITLVDSGIAYGPITESWTIAPGALRGTIYYSTYLSQYFAQVNTAVPGGAGVLAIKPGATSPTVAIPGSENQCLTCHSVSADGSKVFASSEPGADLGTAYDFATGMQTGPTYDTEQVAYMTPYPDGTLVMPSSGQGDQAGDGYAGDSVLFEQGDAGAVATSGWTDAVTQAVTPAFSPSGRSLAFNFWSGAGANGVTAGGGHELAVMDFGCGMADAGVSCGAPPYGFSNLRSVYSDPARWPSWPSFTPDDQSLVFQSLSDPGSAPTYIFTYLGARAQLFWANVPAASGAAATAAPLDALNGIRNGASYLPTSALHPDDTTLNYEPTVNVVPSGGYYWVVFTSRRLYGNVITADPFDGPFTSPHSSDGDFVTPIPKKLWVAAIDIDATPGTDRSHPAFYLPGQELDAINARGFWVLDPCKVDGASCGSGDECCGGYCAGDGGLTCSSVARGCAQALERCATTADCCGAAGGYTCINRICSLQEPR